jgi:hypothetical protein
MKIFQKNQFFHLDHAKWAMWTIFMLGMCQFVKSRVSCFA